jgi:hypothetical protein
MIKCKDACGEKYVWCQWWLWLFIGLVIGVVTGALLPGPVVVDRTVQEVVAECEGEVLYKWTERECPVVPKYPMPAECIECPVMDASWKHEAEGCVKLLERAVTIGRQCQVGVEMMGRELEKCRSNGWRCPTQVGVKVVEVPEECAKGDCFLKGVEAGVE